MIPLWKATCQEISVDTVSIRYRVHRGQDRQIGQEHVPPVAQKCNISHTNSVITFEWVVVGGHMKHVWQADCQENSIDTWFRWATGSTRVRTDS